MLCYYSRPGWIGPVACIVWGVPTLVLFLQHCYTHMLICVYVMLYRVAILAQEPCFLLTALLFFKPLQLKLYNIEPKSSVLSGSPVDHGRSL